jgi:hypothetical protein
MSEFAFTYRMWRFLRKPWPEKVRSLRYRFKRLWNKAVPFVPLPTRLPWGDWWLAYNDVCGDAIFAGNFEEAERQFMERFLKPNMIVLDIGAHHGFYTLLASHKVGPTGQVIAFEPLPAGVSTASLAFALEPKEKCLGGTFCFREP